MREIKFRAWKKSTRKMLFWNDLYDLLSKPSLHEVLGGLVADIIPLEYTGLKDKNGAEIYEGHIVTVTVWDHFNVSGDIDKEACLQGRQVREIRYIEGNASFIMANPGKGFIVNQWNGSEALFQTSDRHEIEIIGNIYENPELLKEGNKMTDNELKFFSMRDHSNVDPICPKEFIQTEIHLQTQLCDSNNKEEWATAALMRIVQAMFNVMSNTHKVEVAEAIGWKVSRENKE